MAGHTYSVGDGRLIDVEDNGFRALRVNLYNPSTLRPAEQATEDDVRPFLHHLELLCAIEPQAAGPVLDWMAWIAQNPSGKMRWAPLLYGGQGSGKDTLFKPLVHIVGAHNYVEIGPFDLEAPYNPYARKRFIVLNEMQRRDRFSAYDAIKPMISGTTGDYVTINEKYKGHYPARNRMAWVVFTNHADAMPMEGDDRRFYVVEVRHPLWPNVKPSAEEKERYFAPLHQWMENDGAALVFRYLLDRDVSAFDHANPPSDTQAKRNMRRAAMSVLSRWLAEECEVGTYSRRQIVCAREVRELAEDRGQQNAHARAIKDGLQEAGFYPLTPIPLLPGKEHRNATVAIYVRDTDMVGWSPDRLRAALYAEMTTQYRDRVFGDWQPEGWEPATPMDLLRRKLRTSGPNVVAMKPSGGSAD